jgi:hypothetical protein
LRIAIRRNPAEFKANQQTIGKNVKTLGNRSRSDWNAEGAKRRGVEFVRFENRSLVLLTLTGLKQTKRGGCEMGQCETKQNECPERRRNGMGQLSLVEHALCPLDPGLSLSANAAFEYEYHFTDSNRHQRIAKARVICPGGLSASDDFFLWGLLALTFSQPEPDGELHATPHYCLRRLGLIDQHSRRGGRQYQQFADAIERLSLVSYRNDAFYDPVRAEHRRVSFGFLSYSLPLDPESSRAWRIAWDSIFYECVRATGGHMRFDLAVYRQLDPASRRLFLFASKLFSRRGTTPQLDLRHLAVNVMGFQPTVAVRDLKQKVGRSVGVLTKLGVFAPAAEQGLFRKRGPGRYAVLLHRGGFFQRRVPASLASMGASSALDELLRSLGLEEAVIVRMQRRYPQRLLGEWADITFAAKERFGPGFFKKSAQAYFVDNVQNASQGARTAPEWWHELRALERKRRRSANPVGACVADESGAVLDRIREAVFESAPEPASNRDGLAPIKSILLSLSPKKQ